MKDKEQYDLNEDNVEFLNKKDSIEKKEEGKYKKIKIGGEEEEEDKINCIYKLFQRNKVRIIINIIIILIFVVITIFLIVAQRRENQKLNKIIIENQELIKKANEYLLKVAKKKEFHLVTHIMQPNNDCQLPDIIQDSEGREIFGTYCWLKEDIILYNVLKDSKTKFYIDVGANDPIYSSVTKALYDRCWKGINIEPVEKLHKRNVLLRPRDINLNYLVGDKEDYIDFNERLANSEHSSVHINITKVYEKDEKNILTYKRNMTTLTKICDKYCPKVIDFCKIDVEGFEENVVKGFDLKKYRPKVFCIEANSFFGVKDTKFEKYLLENDYEFVFENYVDRYYTDKHIGGLKEKFISLEELDKKYLIVK